MDYFSIVRAPRLCLALACLLFTCFANAQGIPDRNVNVIGANPPAGGVPDAGLKQQNEPACAMKPSQPLHILCAFNDYRGVDNPLIGDAWEGYAYSINGGQTWASDLLPGHPGDAPNTGFAFAADPQVTAAPGVALINFIAADRGDGAAGGLFLQRLFEANREAGSPWIPEMLPKKVVSGNAGQFIDKPFQLLHLAPPGSGTVLVSSTLKDGTAVSQEVPAGRLFLAYTTFIGNSEKNQKSRMTVARSDDYGESWKSSKLTQGNGLNQSASLAADGNTVCAVWRRFAKKKDTDAIVASCSTNLGKKWQKAKVISSTPDFFQFDQGTTENTFRTNSYPVITSDGEKFYAFWASRINNDSPFFSRIVYSSSTNGSSWSAPAMVEDVANGHQFMPAVAAADGVVQLAWYDTRNDLFQGVAIQDVVDSTGEKVIRHPGDVRTVQLVDGVVTTNSVQVSRYVEGAREENGPVEQLEFNFLNDRLFKEGTVPFDGDYPNVVGPQFRLEDGEWVSNASASNTEKPVDFLVSWTDNRDVRGNVWEDLNEPTKYTPANVTAAAAADKKRLEAEAGQNKTRLAESSEKNTSSTPEHAVSTDPQVAAISVPGSGDEARADAEPDPSNVFGECVADGNDRDRTRNQNVYSSVVRPGVSIESPSASKPTGSVQRAHVIWISNNSSDAATYSVTIDEQPSDAPDDGRASFLQVPVAPFTSPEGLLTEITVDIDANSTVARTVFITSMDANPPIAVSVSDGGGAALGTITLNPDILTPDVQNPDVQNPDVQNPDIQNAEVHNPDVQNPVITTVQNPDVQNPDVQNPDVQNPDVQNPDYQNPDVQNPDIQNPDLQNTSLAGSSTENPDVEHPMVSPEDRDAGYTDITWEVENEGNTTTAFNLDAFISGDTDGLSTQLIATRTQVTETSRDCMQGRQVQNQVIFNLIDPDLGLFEENTNAGIFGDGSAYVAPGERIFVTLRVWGDPDTFDPNLAGIRTESQSCNTEDKEIGSETTECDPPSMQIGEFNDEPPVISVDPEPVSIPDSIPRIFVEAENGDVTGAGFDVEVSATDDIDGTEIDLVCSVDDDDAIVSIDDEGNAVFLFGFLELGDPPLRIDCLATDSSGNTSEVSFDILAVDTTPPEIIIERPDGETTNFVFETFSNEYNVYFLGEFIEATETENPEHVTAFDQIDFSDVDLLCTTVASGPLVSASGLDETIFPASDEGTSTEVTCTATDSSGNTAEDSFNVIVFLVVPG